MEDKESFILTCYRNVAPDPLTLAVVGEKEIDKIAEFVAMLQSKWLSVFPTPLQARRAIIQLLWGHQYMLPDHACLGFVCRSSSHLFADNTLDCKLRYVVMIGYGIIDENHDETFDTVEEARSYVEKTLSFLNAIIHNYMARLRQAFFFSTSVIVPLAIRKK